MRGWSGFRPPRRASTFRLKLLVYPGRAGAFAYFLKDGGGRVTRNYGNGDDAASGGFHFFAAYDLVAGPIASLHEDIRKQAGDGFAWRQIIENHYGVDGFQSSENFGALALGDYRAAIALELANTSIAVEADDEDISQFAGQFEAADMSGMEQVKTAIGEDDAASVAFLTAKPQNRFLKCQDC